MGQTNSVNVIRSSHIAEGSLPSSPRPCRRVSIASRLMIAFLLATMIPMAFVVGLTLIVAQTAIQREVTINLNAVADAKVDRIERYAGEVRRNVIAVAHSADVGRTLQSLSAASLRGFDDATFLEEVRTARNELLRMTSDFGYCDLFLLDTHGVALFSMKNSVPLGLSFAQESHRASDLGRVFDQARNLLETELGGLTCLPEEAAPSAFIAAPVFSQGQMLGVVAFRVSNEDLLRIIHEITSLGETGQTIVATREGEAVRLVEPAVLNLKGSFGVEVGPDSLRGTATQKAISGQKGSGITTDFQGNEVLAAWRYVPSMRWGMVVKVEPGEAFAPVIRLREMVAGIVLLILLVATIASALVSRWISKPLVLLTNVAHEVATGDLSHVVEVDGPEEIGRLGQAFNIMTAELKHLYGTIEDQVRTRTDQLLQTERKVAYLLNATAEAIYAIDLDGVCTFCNPACVKLLGYRHESELIGKKLHALISCSPDDDRAQVGESSIWEALSIAENRHSDNEVFWRADGTPFAVEYSAHPLFDEGRIVGSVVNFLDITERKQVRAQLMAAKETAEEASRSKSQFLANMSHELRTPLNAVIGYSEMLQEEAEEGGQVQFIPDLKKIQIAGTHLLELINSVLDLAKIEAGKVDLFLEDIDAAKLCEEVVSLIQPLSQKNENVLTLVLPEQGVGRLCADLMKLRQCLFNLLSNAFKFTEHGEIALTVRRDKDGDGRSWVSFEVRDTGVGLNASQMSNLFRAFTQADSSTTRKFGGTGLGLVISRRFCQMMGGDITMSSEPGVGSTFTIKIPAFVTDPNVDDLASGPVPEVPNPKGTVLVIDDDVTVHDLMRRILARESFLVATATTGEEGIRLARELRPDAVTLDVMMPGGDGWSVLAEMKSDPGLADIPVVMMTIVDHRNMAFSMGAAEFLTKPIDRKRLRQVMSKYRQLAPTNRVLVVQDDRTTRTLSRKMLETEGYLVDEAENGRVALDRIIQSQPDLILMDLSMPEMHGFAFVEALLANEEWRKIPMIVVTARDLDADDRRRLTGTIGKILEAGKKQSKSSMEEFGHLVASMAIHHPAGPVASVR